MGCVFLWSGWGKLNDMPVVIENFVGWGIPFAKILAPFVSGVEFVGGLSSLRYQQSLKFKCLAGEGRKAQAFPGCNFGCKGLGTAR